MADTCDHNATQQLFYCSVCAAVEAFQANVHHAPLTPSNGALSSANSALLSVISCDVVVHVNQVWLHVERSMGGLERRNVKKRWRDIGLGDCLI
jgi:hypothetical protein